MYVTVSLDLGTIHIGSVQFDFKVSPDIAKVLVNVLFYFNMPLYISVHLSYMARYVTYLLMLSL